jgi:transposase
VRYHLRRRAAQAQDGRAKPSQIARQGLEAAVRHWWAMSVESLPEGRRPNIELLHAWLVAEHAFQGSVKSVRKWVRQHLPAAKLRCFRRVETPPGAQAQVDWSEHRGVDLGDGVLVTLWVFHLVLSHSRKRVSVACLGCDQLWWHRAHTEALRRIGGVPAVIRIDNCKTGVSHGAGAWGTVSETYQRFARSLGFHVDPCQVRSPRHKGKVERAVRSFRQEDILRFARLGLEGLQGWIDQQDLLNDQRRRCPATGGTVAEAWAAERALLRPLPDPLPEPFDLVRTGRVSADCLVAFEGRQYGVPFPFVGLPVEVRGCAGRVQIVDPGTATVLVVYPRHSRELILIDPRIYDGPEDPRVARPTPLGAMGRRLAELASQGTEHRSIDLYAALAEVAR